MVAHTFHPDRYEGELSYATIKRDLLLNNLYVFVVDKNTPSLSRPSRMIRLTKKPFWTPFTPGASLKFTSIEVLESTALTLSAKSIKLEQQQ